MTEEKEAMIEDLICAQEEKPGSNMSPREIEKHTGISQSSVRRMVKKKGLRQFKRLKAPRMSEGIKERRSERAGTLAERFGKGSRIFERLVWQDEKDFTLKVPLNPQNSRVYRNGSKSEIDDARPFHQTNSRKK